MLPGRARRLQRLPGAVRPPSTCRLRSAADTASATQDGVPVTNAAGNLTDEFGNQINGDLPDQLPGLPRLRRDQRGPDAVLRRGHAGPTASRSSTCTSPISTATRASAGTSPQRPDHAPTASRHPRRSAAAASATSTRPSTTTTRSRSSSSGWPPTGITPKNTLFVLSSDEGDHEAGANVGRAIAAHPGRLRRRDGAACTSPGRILRRAGRQRDRAAAGEPATPRRSAWRPTPRRSST